VNLAYSAFLRMMLRKLFQRGREQNEQSHKGNKGSRRYIRDWSLLKRWVYVGE